MPGSRAFRTVLLAALAGQLSAATVGALPWAGLAVSVPLLVGLAVLGRAARGRRAAQLRGLATALAAVVAVVALPRLAGGEDAVDLKGTLGLLLVAVQVLHGLCWQADRDLRTGLVVAGGLLVLGASYAPDVLVGAPLVLGWAALLVAVGQLSGVRARDLLPATALAMVLGLVAFLVVPVPQATGVRSRLARVGQSSDLATRGAQGTFVFSGPVLDLRVRGNLPGDPVARVDPGAPPLWRGATFDAYDGRRWFRPPVGFRERTSPVVVRSAAGPTRTDDVELLTVGSGVIWSPGPVVSVVSPGVGLVGTSPYGDVELSHQGNGYSVVSELMPTSDAALRRTSGADVQDPVWLALPPTLPTRVRDLARDVTSGTTGRWEAAEAIAGWLRENAVYALDSPRPGVGEDAVDRFLFVDRRGFCEQFASAQVVMLRALGVPARLVTGLAYGTERDDGRVFTMKDLHAWTELWVPGTGWVASDPTAGVPLAEGAGGSLRARVSTAVTRALRATTDLPGGRVTTAGLLLALTGAVALLARRRPRAAPARGGIAAAGPALAAFRRLDERLGPRRRRPPESLRELGERLDPSLAPALRVVERECYSDVPPDPAEAVRLLDSYRPR